MTPSTHERFPPTSWTLIELVQRAEGDEYRSLMQVVVERYIRPVHHFIRTRGYSQSDAPDLTNEFFMKLYSEREWLLGRAMQEAGKFRNLLLTALTRFLSDRRPGRVRQQTAFEMQQIPLSILLTEQEMQWEPVNNETPEDVFWWEYVVGILGSAMQELKASCQRSGHAIWYAVFLKCFFSDDTRGTPTLDEIARELGLSRHQVKYARDQTRSKFRKYLRRAVGSEMSSSAAIDEELRWITSLFLRRGHGRAIED